MSAPVAVSGLAAGQVDQSPAPPETWVEAQIMICLAGRCAEVRARRPDRDGWRRLQDWRARVADHESGHLVAAVGVGRRQNGAAIEMVENGCRGIAEHHEGDPPDGSLDCPTFEGFETLQRDFAKATDYAKLATGMRGWLAYLRTLWLRTDAILADHWPCLKMLSGELQRTGRIPRGRAKEIIDKSWHLRGTSLVEALTREPPDPQHHQEQVGDEGRQSDLVP